jgi:hypothetical protein
MIIETMMAVNMMGMARWAMMAMMMMMSMSMVD